MGLTVKPLVYTDYTEHLVPWWKDWNWVPPLRGFLPDNGVGGIMVWDGDMPICAGFLYVTNSDVAWVDWIVSSKAYRKKPDRGEAIDLLVETLTAIAKNTGHKFSYALLKHHGLEGTYERAGYTKGDAYTTEMIKAL
jgi:hypothetical protein